jgi:hypothetical protein
MRSVQCSKTECKLKKIKNQIGAGPGFSGLTPFVFNYTVPLHKVKSIKLKKRGKKTKFRGGKGGQVGGGKRQKHKFSLKSKKIGRKGVSARNSSLLTALTQNGVYYVSCIKRRLPFSPQCFQPASQ